MKLAYFDCFSGAAGDMIVGALLDAGLPLQRLQEALAGLKLEHWSISAEKVRRGGLAGTKFHVHYEEHHHHEHRHLADILALIDSAGLAPRAAATARAVFERLAAAEAKVHGVGVEEVHFHEVGAVDSIVDIVGSAVALDLMGIEQLACSAIPTGSGQVKTAHGLLPIPAPATAELLRGAPIRPSSGEAPTGELTTPTGAAILTTVAASFGPAPAMSLEAVGYGAGTRDSGPLPNLLRVLVGQIDEAGSADTVVELSANLDDCSGQVLGATVEALLSAGCLDAWCQPITMKKSRPAWMLSALCQPGDVPRIERLFFAETPTLGVRRRVCQRTKLLRRHETVETPYGAIRVKIGSLAPTEAGSPADSPSHAHSPATSGPGLGRQHDMTAAAEFADCAAAATAHGVPVREVIAAAMAAFRAGR